MANIITVGTRANPMHVGGHFRITNVGWPGGVFVSVLAHAEYRTGTMGSRRGRLSITFDGEQVGGSVLAERNIDVPANTFGIHNAGSNFYGVMKFSRPLTGLNTAFVLHLDGSLQVTDTDYPFTINEFCGLTTQTTTLGQIYSTPIEGTEAVNLWQDMTTTISSPAGSSSGTWVLGPLADLSKEDIGTGSMSKTVERYDIWYEDQFGNLVNTHESCDALTAPGDMPPTTSTKTEGWSFIQVIVQPRKGYEVLPATSWNANMGANNLFTQKAGPAGENVFGGPFCNILIPRTVVGQDSDFLPIYDELPEGDYEYRLANHTFSQFVAQVPTQRQPNPDAPDVWRLPVAWPMAPDFARYDIGIGTRKPPPYAFHPTLPLMGTHQPAPYAAGQTPGSDQTFVP